MATRKPAARKPAARRRPGRPTKLTDKRAALILDALRAGNYLETAAAAAGVHRDTLNEWRHKFPDFSDAVEKARAEAEVGHVGVIRRAAVETWQAAAWWLERSFPERWGRRDRHQVEHSGEVGITLAKLHELAAAAEVEMEGEAD